MITEDLIRDILKQYSKHGWNLSRVLLLPETASILSASYDSLFGNATVDDSEIDAAWFYRPTMKNRTAWEIRHLSANPFALCGTFENNLEESVLFKSLGEMETCLKEKTSKASV